MRSLLFTVMTVFSFSAPHLVRAEEESLSAGEPSPAQVVIEARFVSITPDFETVLEHLGIQNEAIVPPAVEPEALFSPATVADSGSSSIQLISASTVVVEQNPIHVETIKLQEMLEFIQLFQQDSRTNVVLAPKVTVWDRDTAEIADVQKRPFVVDRENGTGVVREYQEGTTILARPCVKDSGSLQLDLQIRFDQIEDVVVSEKSETQQVQTPRVKTFKIELSAHLKPGETLAVWGGDSTTPEVAVPATGISKILRKKSFTKTPKSSLILLITPSVLAQEVVAAPRKRE